jgi:Flp pilus assembly protein TadB
MSQEEEKTVRVPVEVHDEKLSGRANEILTEEVREALQTDEVEVSESHADELGRADLSATSQTMTSVLWESRVLVGVSFFTAIVVGAILALVTGEWWAILIAEAVHFVATLIVTYLAIQSSTNVDKPSADHVEALEEEGVRDPEETLNNAIQEFAGDGEDRGKKVVRPNDAGRAGAPGGAALDQQGAMTPSSAATEAPENEDPKAGNRDEPSPALMPIVLYGALIVLCFVIPIVTGVSALWVTPAIAVPVIVVALLVHLKWFANEAHSEAQADAPARP